MGDTLSIDTEAIRSLASDVERCGVTASEIEASARSTLMSVDLPGYAAAIVAELADELTALAQFLDAVAERTELADRFGSSLQGQGWFEAMHREWSAAESAMWASLLDDVGADPMTSGTFDLADSLVMIPRSHWLETAIPPGCRNFGPDAHYTGGGAVRGPDGELYPIVVPHLVVGDQVVTIDDDPAGASSVASLGGADVGWEVVGYRTGVAQVHDDPELADLAIMGLGAMLGSTIPPTVDDAHLPKIHFRLGSRPTFHASAPASGGSDPSVAESAQSLTPTAPVGSTPTGAARINRSNNVMSLAIGALQGVSVARSLDNANSRAYEVIFEHHPDGRRRSRVQTFALEAKEHGVILAAWHFFVDDEGTVLQTPVKYPEPEAAMAAPDTVFAGNSISPDYVRPLPNSALEVER